MNINLKNFIVIFLLVGPCGLAWPQSGKESIVPAEETVSDEQAMAALVWSLLKLDTAAGRAEALRYVKILSERKSFDRRIQAELADIQIALGHYKAGCALYMELLSQADGADKKLILDFAERRLLWGDFYGAERFWRNRIQEQADPDAAVLRLAAVLAGAERYEEAKAICRELWLREPRDPAAGMELARVLMLQKRFLQAAETARQMLDFPEWRREACTLRGEAFLALGRYEEAEIIFSRLANEPAATADDLVRLGRVRLKLDRIDAAKQAFAAALVKKPGHIEALFRAADNVESEVFLEKLLADETEPARLTDWAELYKMEGLLQHALACYEQALRLDPDYFLASEGRAFVLAGLGRHSEAAERYRELLSDFPESRKLHLSLARTLAWGRSYDESLDAYDLLFEKHPEDLILQREAARVALWGKMFDEAMRRYDRILTPGVAERLHAELLPLSKSFLPELRPAWEKLEVLESGESGLDAFREWSEKAYAGALPDAVAAAVCRLSGQYEIQRAVFHEREYKRLQWQHRYARARREASRLIKLTPENQEAVFDRAQLNCMLGLYDEARRDYEYLFRLDPTHSIAQEALELARIDARPGLRMDGAYWHEQGRGGLSDIRRYAASLGLDFPRYCRMRPFFEAQRRLETPGNHDERIDSWRYTLGCSAIFNPYLRGELSGFLAYYDLGRYDDTHGGQGRVWANLDDFAQLGVGVERADELYNRFGFARKLQSDSIWLDLNSNLTRHWDADFRFRHISYNDDNNGRSLRLATGYDFSDHPGIFKATLAAEHRHTAEESKFVYDAFGNLSDIIHPYWTPQDYLWGGVTLEWWHDISGPHQYCGNRRHFYDLKLTLGNDSESNAGVAAEAEWQRRFSERCSLELHGYIHRSRDWDAEGIWLSINCRI